MKTSKKLLAVIMSAILTVAFSVFAFAENVGTANSAVTSAVSTIANDMVATGNAVIPIALTVVGIGMVVIFGIRIFKRVVGKS